jgi:hypothetical protein
MFFPSTGPLNLFTFFGCSTNNNKLHAIISEIRAVVAVFWTFAQKATGRAFISGWAVIRAHWSAKFRIWKPQGRPETVPGIHPNMVRFVVTFGPLISKIYSREVCLIAGPFRHWDLFIGSRWQLSFWELRADQGLFAGCTLTQWRSIMRSRLIFGSSNLYIGQTFW